MQLKKDEEQKREREFFGVALNLLAELPERAQSIFRQRFGLAQNLTVETLDKIGINHNVTRERIRQILTFHKKQIVNKCEEAEFRDAENKLIFTIENNYGIVKEVHAMRHLNTKEEIAEENALRFLVDCSKNVQAVFERTFLEKSWVASRDVLVQAKKVLMAAENVLKKEKRTLTGEELARKLMLSFPDFSKKAILSFLESSVRVKSNQFGKWGLKDWPEISPKGSREKIYLILKEEKVPLHFTKIAKLIDKHRLGEKKAHPQTIHNELIKDKRFILIGRGIYALSEWGYYKGAVKDVLRDILVKHNRPMTREELIAEVLKIRKVKKTTITINLNNNKLFERAGNSYRLK